MDSLTLDWGAREEIQILKDQVKKLQEGFVELAKINTDLANLILVSLNKGDK